MNYSPLELDLLLEGADLGRNETKRFDCPFCNCQEKNSLTLYRNEYGLHYRCQRDSCGARRTLDKIPGSPKAVKRKLKEYNYVLPPLRAKDIELFRDRFQLTFRDLKESGFKYNSDLNTIAIPIYDEYKQQVGWVDRDYYNARVPKVIIYWTKETDARIFWTYNNFYWQYSKLVDTILLVEDPISAIRASKHINSVALLGTGLSEKHMLYLRKRFSNILVCLDEDAQTTALKYKTLYSSLFKSWVNLFFEKDVKDLEKGVLKAELVERGII